MSLQFVSSLNKPHIVMATGAMIAGGFPLFPALPLGFLQLANVLAFATNVAAVSVPGRLDGEQDRKMRQGDINPDSTSLHSAKNSADDLLSLRRRTLVAPSGWAFTIWGPVYAGEALFCVAQFIGSTDIASSLPQVTAPFVAANLLQSLWCVSFRPSFNQGWHKYVSCAMLGGTAYALSHIPFDQSWYYLPMAIHFGWTTAATLVNLNGSIAMSRKASDTALVALGHASAVTGTLLGVGVTALGLATPAYGLTVAWALAAVASGVKFDKAEGEDSEWSSTMQRGAKVQRILCLLGSALCVSTAAFRLLNY